MVDEAPMEGRTQAETAGEGCVFCDIVADRAPAYRVYEDEQTVVILDVNPYTAGHCLAIPRRHVPWWHDLEDKESEQLFRAARRVARRMKRVFSCDFVFLYARGRRIPHTHLFLIPTHKDDVLDRFFAALEGFQEAPPALAQLRDPAQMKDVARRLRGQ